MQIGTESNLADTLKKKRWYQSELYKKRPIAEPNGNKKEKAEETSYCWL